MVDKFALREAFINAIVHNDYTSGVTPLVEIFSDRIVITSYGGLPDGLSLEDFFACCSKPRNRELMRVFRDMELVEQIGSGMSRILAAYDRSIFKFTPNFMTVTLPVEMADDTKESADDTKDDTKSDTKADTKADTNEPLDAVMMVLRQQPSITRAEIADQLSISSATISRIIKNLVETRQISRVGSRRSGHWEVKSTGGDTKDDTKGDTKDDTKESLDAVLALMRENSSITREEIAAHLNISSATASRAIKTLVETRRISRAGGRRFGHWVVA